MLKGFTLSLRATLLSAMVGLLVVTVGAIGVITLVGTVRSLDEVARTLGDEVSRGVAAKVRGVLTPPHAVLAEFHALARRGLLAVDDPAALADRLVERLRVEPALGWLSYGDERGRFTGAWRRPDGKILLNRSWVERDRGRLVEEIVHPDGARELVRRNDDWDYDPRRRPWYRLAAGHDGTVWTAPYEWWDNQGLGISAVLALRDGATLRGVFTADLLLADLSSFLDQVALRGSSRKVFLLTRTTEVLAGPRGAGVGPAARVDPVLRAALDSLPVPLAEMALDRPVTASFEHGGVPHMIFCQVFAVPGGLEWATLMYVQRDELFGVVQRNLRTTILVGGVSLLLAVLVAVTLSTRIARPLREIADDLVRVGRFELGGDRAPSSRVREVAVVGDTAARMKASLRSFSRYVPADLVRETLAAGREATLGAELRTLTIFFADVEGFSRICELLRPDQLVRLASDYFTVVDDHIGRHGGTVDKFIGDGVLAFFNAPTPLADHPGRACRASLELQRALAPGREAWAARGRVPTRVRIGLHTSEVLVGNIGTPTRFHYTVIGDGVNLTNGLQLLSKVYETEIIGSQETRAGAGPGFEWRRLDRVVTKGSSQSRDVFELLGEVGSVPAHVLAARDTYEKARDAYMERRFADAARGFRHALDVHPGDHAAQVMLERCDASLVSPPPADWDGVYIHRG